jgi:hypothetical protein
MGAMRNAYDIFFGKPEVRPRRRWEDNIRMDLRVKVWDWIPLTQNRDQWRTLMNMIMKLRVP